MKVTIQEHDYGFGFDFVAENIQEAAWITRFQLNVKRKFPFISTTVSKEGKFRQWMGFDRKVEKKSSIQ